MSILPMYIQGYAANKISTLVNSKLHWNTELYGDCVDAQCFSDRIASQLGSLVVTNHIAEANVCNVDANGFNIKYLNSYPTGSYLSSCDYEFLRFGPIPIPKLIYLDAYFGLAGSHREVFHISAVCDNKIYTLLHVIQAHVDGNYSYANSSGIYVDHAGTKLLNFYTGRGSYTYTGSANPREFTRCFTNGETECYISITRPNHTYTSGATYPSANTSTLSIKELKIEW